VLLLNRNNLTICLFFISFYWPQLFYCPPFPTVVPVSLETSMGSGRLLYLRLTVAAALPAQKFGGAKMFDFRRVRLFCLEKRLSKHKMTVFSKNLGGYGSFAPPSYAYAR